MNFTQLEMEVLEIYSSLFNVTTKELIEDIESTPPNQWTKYYLMIIPNSHYGDEKWR